MVVVVVVVTRRVGSAVTRAKRLTYEGIRHDTHFPTLSAARRAKGRRVITAAAPTASYVEREVTKEEEEEGERNLHC